MRVVLFRKGNSVNPRKYQFDWALVGDIERGRLNLGPRMDVEIYRLMQFTLRDVLEARFGAKEADLVFYEAGKLAGQEFYKRFMEPVSSADEFISKLQQLLKEKLIGIMRIEEEDIAGGRVVLTVGEDLECSGLPELDYETCIYDEGFIAALFCSYTKMPWSAKEVDCWTTGSRTCRFLVTLDQNTDD